ncbi:MAG TPA: hypothetical protein ENO22_05855 [candidate division Zixibacteria bacterium]|nr:hypothetical protein [candidate division Zixibacteria bacterium]HEQ98848.1 hypothetical protein [candidate division Zixibacteria bacterium]
MSTKNYPTVISERTLDEGPVQLLKEFPEDQFNLAMPARVIQYLPPGHKIVLSTIKLNVEDEKKGDFYPTPKQSGRISPSSQALIKIGNAAGINWFKTHITKERQPESYELLAVRATVWGQYIDMTGDLKIVTNSKSIDRKSLEATGLSKADIAKRIEFAVERCISGAMARAVKKEFGIPSSFLPKELGRPFVAGRLMPEWDMNNPLHAKLLMERGQHAADRLYGKGRTEEPEITESTVLRRSEEEPAGSETKPQKASPKPKSQRADLLEVKAEIKRLCQQLGKKPPQPLDDMTEPNLRGFYQYLLNQEAEHGRK